MEHHEQSTPAKTLRHKSFSALSMQLSFEDLLEDECAAAEASSSSTPKTPRWTGFDISRTQSELSFALHVSLSEQNLCGLPLFPPPSPAGAVDKPRRRTVRVRLTGPTSLSRPSRRALGACAVLQLIPLAVVALVLTTYGTSWGPAARLAGRSRPLRMAATADSAGVKWPSYLGFPMPAADDGGTAASASVTSQQPWWAAAASLLGFHSNSPPSAQAPSISTSKKPRIVSPAAESGPASNRSPMPPRAFIGKAVRTRQPGPQHAGRSKSWTSETHAELAATATEALRAEMTNLVKHLTPLTCGADSADVPPPPHIATAGFLMASLLAATASPSASACVNGANAEANASAGDLREKSALFMRAMRDGLAAIAATNASAFAAVPTTATAAAGASHGVCSLDDSRKVPEGFDIDAAIKCASLSAFSYTNFDRAVGAPDNGALRERCATLGLEIVQEFHTADSEQYALLAQGGDELYLVFRGSCKLENFLTDIDYHDSEGDYLASYVAETGVPLPRSALVHRGFLEVWRELRGPVLEALEPLMAGSPLAGKPKLKLFVTGHSMGGAIGQLASLELRHRFGQAAFARAAPKAVPLQVARHLGSMAKLSPLSRYGVHCTYTFAAPRLGNRDFAEAYSQSFPHEADHWAVQALTDAVPHLPFAAWGFMHPEGVLVLGDESGTPRVRLGDRGDDVSLLRPKEGRIVNWAMSHDMENYINHLRDIAGYDESFSV